MAQVHTASADLLRQVWADVRRSGPELVLVEGPAGIGKSFLLNDLRQSVLREGAHHAVLAGGNLVAEVLHGLPELGNLRSAAFIEAARSFLPDHPWPRVVGGHPGRHATQEPPEISIARAVSDSVSPDACLLLVVEDLHDHYAQSQAFLSALWTRCLLDERPVLLVLSSRPLTDHPAAQALMAELQRTSQLIRGRSGLHEHLGLADAAGVQALTRARLGDGVPDELPAWLLAHAEGHPLRTAELIHLLRDQGALTRIGYGWRFIPPPSASLPASLSAVIQERLRTVSKSSGPWRLMVALAVLGGPASERPWRQVAQVSQEVFTAAREWLLRRELIRVVNGGATSDGALGKGAAGGQSNGRSGEPSARFQCGHPLYGPLLLDELGWNDLISLHARAASADLDILEQARHARHAELESAPGLTRLALAAAVQRGAHADVIREATELLGSGLLGSGLPRNEGPDDKSLKAEAPEAFFTPLAVRTALVRALCLTGDLESAVRETEAPACPQPSGSLRSLRAQALMELGRLEEATTLARAALAEPDVSLTGTEEGLIFEDVLYRGLVNLGQLDEAEREVDAALAADPPPDGARRMLLLDLRARVAHRRGDYHLSLHLSQEAVRQSEHDHLEESREPRHAEQCWNARNSAGGSAIHMALWDEAERHLIAAHALVTRHAMTSRLMVVEGNFAYVQLMRGEYPAAEAGSWVQHRRAEASGNLRVQGALLWNIGICRLWRGDAAGALDCMLRSLELWPSVGSANATDFAEALAFQGRLDEAREMLARPNHDHYPEHPNSRARVHLLLGEPHLALQAVQGVSVQGGHGLYARSCLVRAQAHLLLGQAGPADACLNEADTQAALAQHRSVGAEVSLCRAVLHLHLDGNFQQTGTDAASAGAARAEARACWAEAAADLQYSGGQGHLKFVRTLFAAQVSALEDPDRPSAPPPTRARLRLLGTLQVQRPGARSGDVRPWKARKVKELLALLVCAYYEGGAGDASPGGSGPRQLAAGGTLTREHLMLELWPDADKAGAELSFRKTVARLRESLGDAAEVIRDAQGRYGLAGVNADLNDFLGALERQLDAVAVSTYAAPFMTDMDLSAVPPLRDDLHDRWRQALLRFAENEPQAAQPHLVRLLSHDPLDLEVTLALLHTHRVTHDRGAHAARLQQAQALYASALGEVPEELRSRQLAEFGRA
ncbi:AAA family ATPase [Deinococcus altitudinis]|uniref:AAA family ATPase n=1 Tax=Deinococcus altitudinis TaxID=468914 RepID=UPI00389220D3